MARRLSGIEQRTIGLLNEADNLTVAEKEEIFKREFSRKRKFFRRALRGAGYVAALGLRLSGINLLKLR